MSHPWPECPQSSPPFVIEQFLSLLEAQLPGFFADAQKDLVPIIDVDLVGRLDCYHDELITTPILRVQCRVDRLKATVNI